MNVLITGGLGYTGVTLIPKLNEDKKINKLVIFDNLSNTNYSFFLKDKFYDKVTFIKGNILDNKLLIKAFRDYKIDTIIHLAAKTLTPMSDNGFHEFDQINHWGTSVLVDSIIKYQYIKKVIFLSSFAVYGTYKPIFTETDEAVPSSNYGKSKFLAEQEIALRLPKEIKKHIFRCGVLYGTNLAFSPSTVLNKFIFDAHFSKKIQVFGNGNQKRPFIHVEQISEILHNATVSNDLKNVIYNVYDNNISINELVKLFSKTYPLLEINYLNRNHEMKSIQLASKYDIYNELKIKNTYSNFEKSLLKEKKNFSCD